MTTLGGARDRTVRRPVRRDRPVEQEHVVRLADGRRLGYAEYGDPSGTPFFFFHGFGSSRLVRHPDDEIAVSLGVRLVAVDRPGIGLSDPMPGRRLLDWPADVRALADALGIARFGVIGWSGGGAYAAACAYALPERVSVVGLISGSAPLSGEVEGDYLDARLRRIARVAGRAPWMVRLALWHWGRPQRKDPIRFFDASVATMVDADRRLLADPKLRRLMIANSGEVYRQGGRGMYDEGLVLARPWGFRVEDITTRVLLWHGEEDTTVPTAMGRYLARAIPRCKATFYPGLGHHMLYARWREILTALATEGRASPTG